MKLSAFCHLAHCSFLEGYKEWLLQPEYQVDYYKAVWAQPILACGGGEEPWGTGHSFAKRTAPGNTYRCAEPGMRAATKTPGMEFGTRSVKFYGKVGKCKPSPILVWERQSCVCVCVFYSSHGRVIERDPKSLRCPDKPELLRVRQNDRELSLNAHRHNTDRPMIC